MPTDTTAELERCFGHLCDVRDPERVDNYSADAMLDLCRDTAAAIEAATGATLLDSVGLIAASPALLAACQAFLLAPSVGSGGPGSVTLEVQTFNLEAARAAIAAAEARGA